MWRAALSAASKHLFQAKRSVADLDGEASAAEFAGQSEGGGVAFGAEGGDVGVELGGLPLIAVRLR